MSDYDILYDQMSEIYNQIVAECQRLKGNLDYESHYLYTSLREEYHYIARLESRFNRKAGKAVKSLREALNKLREYD